jgi:tetratricopeptide (TPR) repeat protein
MDIPREHINPYVVTGALIFVLLLYLSKKPGPIRILTLWTTALILPTTIGTHDYYYTRYFYLGAMGASGLTAFFLCWALNAVPIVWHIKRSGFVLLLTLLILSGLHKLRIFEGYYLSNTGNYYASPTYANDAGAAIVIYERARSEYQIEDPVLAFNLGSCYEKTNQSTKALQSYEEAIRFNPNDARSHHAIARLLLDSGQINQAISYAQRAAQLSANFINEYHKLGTILYNQNYLEEAHLVFQSALVTSPDHAHKDLVYFNLGAMYQNQGKPQEAIKAYQKSSDLKTEIIELYQNLGKLYLETEQWVKAIPPLAYSTSHDPADADSWRQLAEALEQTGQHTAAETALLNAKKALSAP